MNANRAPQLKAIVGLLLSHMLKRAAVLLVALAISAACNRQRTVATSATSQANTGQETRPKSHDITDPSCCGLSMPANKGIDAAWTSFAGDGHYRLALERDMQFSDAARKEIARTDGRLEWNALNKILAFSWGHLGYDTDQDLVAAIVVDTTRSDSSRFGLVIFGKPRGSAYRPYWLYRDRNLSKTIVYQVSGSLGVMNYHDGGTYDAAGSNGGRSESYLAVVDVLISAQSKKALQLTAR